MPAPKITSVQVRRGLKAEWEQANPLLLDGEIGLETNTYRIKIGHRNLNGELIRWNDLRYQAPFSGHDKPLHPQDGDFWVEEPSLDLYYFDGTEWRKICNSSNPSFEGNINIENACITGDFVPCADAVFKLGVEDKRWNELHLGDTVSSRDFKISVGETTDPDATPGFYRLQLNGDDIAVRDDFNNFDTRNLPLWRTTDENGNLNPTPREYQPLADLEEEQPYNLPPTPNFGTQSQFNAWALDAITLIAGSSENPGARKMDFWNDSSFMLQLEAMRGVRTPVTAENITDYDAATEASTYFHKADGSISDRVPLDQSYWEDVPRI